MNRHAFSLVELLIVVALLALLAGILFPVFAQAREAGRATVCLSNVRQLGLAFRMYTDDWGGVLPGAGYFGRNQGEWVFCPVPWDIRVREGSLWPYVRARAVYTCPSARELPLGYTMNGALDGAAEATLRAPATLLLLIEEDRRSIEGRGSNDSVFRWDRAWDALATYHFNAGTCLYADGHARRVRAERFRRAWGAEPGEEFRP